MKTLTVIFIIFISLCSNIFAQDSTLIGFSMGDFDVDRWYTDRDVFVEQANKLGAKVLVEYAYSDPQKQNEQIRSFIDKGVKTIVIIPTKADALTESVKLCRKKGIKIIAYDKMITNIPIDLYVSFNNKKVGELQANYLTKKCAKGNYAILAGPLKDNNSKDYLAGQMQILKPYIEKGDIKIVYNQHFSEWNSMEAFVKVDSILNTGVKINAILATNDMLAYGSIMALEGAGLNKKVLISGMDCSNEAIENIKNGNQCMTVFKSIEKLATIAAQSAVSISNDKTVVGTNASLNNGISEIPAILLDPKIIDANNIDKNIAKQ